MLEALGLPFFQRVLLAGLLASIACGMLGTFVVAKRISSLAGSLSHAAFGGVGLGYLAGFHPMLGAALFAVIAAVVIGGRSAWRPASSSCPWPRATRPTS
jgi:zinc transport system permease protein